MPNIEAIEQTLTFVQDHPEQHAQDRWICETGACLAGHAVLLNGYSPIHMFNEMVVKTGSPEQDRCEEALRALKAKPGRFSFIEAKDLLYAGEAEHVQDVAQRLFGISGPDATLLFAATNTVEKLELMVKDLGNGEKLRDHWAFERVLNEDGTFEFTTSPPRVERIKGEQTSQG
jgi:hypothetical protein